MRERIFMDLRRKHMFLWLWEFWWLVFCENATERCHELQCVLSEPPALTPTEKKCQQEMEAKELFFFFLHGTYQQFCTVKRSQEWEALWFYTCSVCIFLALTLYDWITNRSVWLWLPAYTLKECAIKTQQFRWRINGESTVLFRRKGPYTMQIYNKSVGCSGTSETTRIPQP